MKISTKGIYAVQFMIFLAQSAKGELVPLKDVAKATDISRKYLEQIALSLTTAQLVHSVRGASGVTAWLVVQNQSQCLIF